jgi:membrane protein implicated in regulation of membrane protease activity
MHFTLPTARLLPEPVSGIVETADLQELRVEYAGTTWPARLYNSNGQTTTLFPGQFVTIVGLEDSITLLIQI